MKEDGADEVGTSHTTSFSKLPNQCPCQIKFPRVLAPGAFIYRSYWKQSTTTTPRCRCTSLWGLSGRRGYTGFTSMERTHSGSSLLCLPRSPVTKRKIVAVRMGQVWYCTAMDVAQQQGRRTRPLFQVAQARAAPVGRVLDNSAALVDTRFIALFKFRHIQMKKIMTVK